MTPKEALQFERVNFTVMGWVTDPGVLRVSRAVFISQGGLKLV